MENQTVFLVHHTIFDYNPGHMLIVCDGIFTSWDVALRKALKISRKEEYEEKNKDIVKKLPTTRGELRSLLSYDSCIWTFESNYHAEWWDGEGPGARLISVSYQEIKEEDNISEEDNVCEDNVCEDNVCEEDDSEDDDSDDDDSEDES